MYTSTSRNGPPLAEHHRRQLEEGSRIASDIIAERSVRTITRGRQLPEGFSRRQRRRGEGILFTVHRPNGETSFSYRPDDPDPESPGRRYEQPSKHYGGPGNVLDVHPSLHHLIGDPDVPVIFVEGIKKADAIISAARAAGVEILVIAISGVWNWLSDGEPIPDMLEIPVEGRRVTVCFDSDMLHNPHVQDAARRLAEHLASRGAEVFITFLRDKPDGSKMGADDFFAAGGTFPKLRMLTRRYDPADFTRIRLSRDEKLLASMEYLWRHWYEADWMQFEGTAERGNWARGHTARDTEEALLELAMDRGKVDERGIVVSAGLRAIADRAAKTAPSVGKALQHLEAEGHLEILNAADKSKPRSYRLLVPSARLNSMEEGATREGNSSQVSIGCKGLRYPTVPRLRWSSPGRVRRREFELVPGRCVVRHSAQVPGAATPEDLEAAPYVKRLGPHRGAVLDVLEAAGGEMHLKDLCEALHRKRPWDVRRRILKPLAEAGIIELLEGDVIRLAGEWLARLEEEREHTGEIEQAERQAEKHREQSRRYREHLARESRGTPEASLAAVRRTKELREKRLQEMREECERDEAPTPPEVERLVSRIMGQNERVRMNLLCEMAMEEGLRWRDVPPGVRRMGYQIERLPEYGNQEFVFARRAA